MKLTGNILLAALLAACNNAGEYRQVAKTSDSLVGAVNAVASELRTADTAQLTGALRKYGRYTEFIHHRLHDTISKTEADGLRAFTASGAGLSHFSENRRDLLARAELITAQLGRLAADARNRSGSTAQMKIHLETEKSAAESFIAAAREQRKILSTHTEELRRSLPAVEALIRSRNNDQLPTVVPGQSPE